MGQVASGLLITQPTKGLQEYRPLSCATFHCCYRGDVSHDLWTVEDKQENWELDSSEIYRSQKNDLVAK